jgi:hypothetical protein
VSIGTALLECFFGREHDDFLDCSILRAFQNQFQLAQHGMAAAAGLADANAELAAALRTPSLVGRPYTQSISLSGRLRADRLPDKMKAPRSHPPADSRRAFLSGKEYRYSHPPKNQN